MPKKRSKKGAKVLGEIKQQQPAVSKDGDVHDDDIDKENRPQKSRNIKDLSEPRRETGDENYDPTLSLNFTTDTAELYNELDSFRQKWKRELQVNSNIETSLTVNEAKQTINASQNDQYTDKQPIASTSRSTIETEKSKNAFQQNYAKAKELFLTAVALEQDEMHFEAIKYYKESIHLYPDIEKQIFQEQRSAINSETASQLETESHSLPTPVESNGIPLIDRIISQHSQDNQTSKSILCKPNQKAKTGSLHMSDLPYELVVQIFRHVIGQELDLASLELLGMTCRGFFILSRDPNLWRSICYQAWGRGAKFVNCDQTEVVNQRSIVEWRDIFIEKPRVNYDGVYISRTRYIRQGDVGFQDITYRPFHVVRYYRYLRFFPDGRVLILTTNEEPDKIIPIFRHALHRKQFSSELSILEGTYELINQNQISIVAEKDFRPPITAQQSTRRPEIHNWARQTPQVQKFILKFKLDTMKSRPYRNNVLKWMEYTILSRFETGQDVTPFDLSPDTFPNLCFARVKKFNLKLTSPLPIL